MIKFFGLPIACAFIAGIFFPYVALNLSSFAFAILFLMMIFAWFEVKLSTLKNALDYKAEIGVGLFFHFIYFPLMQWLIASYTITDQSFRMGLLLASLCPVAIVAPQFSRMHQASATLSYIFMLITMLLFPFTIYMFEAIHLRPLIIDMAILIIAPAIVGITLKTFFPKLTSGIQKRASLINMVGISFLAFTYMGASVAKLNTNYIPWKDYTFVTLLVIFQDFGIYFIARFLFGKIFNRENADALAISIGMKNFALAGGLLLFYDPKASLASAIGFLVHAFFFNYLALKGKQS